MDVLLHKDKPKSVPPGRSALMRKVLILLALFINYQIASAQQEFKVDGFYYQVTDKVSCSLTSVSYENTSTITEANIPEMVTDENGNEYYVTEIGDRAFYNCKQLSSVNIPESVTKIGMYAFGYCN